MNRSPGRGWASPRSTAAPSRSGPVGVVYEKCSPSYRELGSTKEGIPMRYKERGASLSPSPWGDPPLIQCAGEGVSSITGEPSSKTQSPCPARLLLAIALHSPARLSQAPGAGGQPQKTSLAEVILGHRRSGLMACRACCRKTVESLYQRIVDLMVPPAAGDCGTGSPGNAGRRGSRDEPIKSTIWLINSSLFSGSMRASGAPCQFIWFLPEIYQVC